MGLLGAILMAILILLVPPLGVFLLTGCNADFFLNILLTICGYIPGEIHGLYILFIYEDRKSAAKQGRVVTTHAPGIFSERVQSGGQRAYGTV